MRAWIPSRRSYSFTLSDVTHRTACAAPGYIAPEVLQLMEIAGISDFESLAASTNAPVFTPQTDDFGLAVHIFKMLNAEYTHTLLVSWTWTYLTWTTMTFRLHH